MPGGGEDGQRLVALDMAPLQNRWSHHWFGTVLAQTARPPVSIPMQMWPLGMCPVAASLA